MNRIRAKTEMDNCVGNEILVNNETVIGVIQYGVLAYFAITQNLQVGTITVMLAYFNTMSESLAEVARYYMDAQKRISIIERLSRFGAAFQNVLLFNGTIRKNLEMGETIQPEKLKRACHNAGLSEYIPEQKDGLDTMLEPWGSNLSGVQRQRILLAKAFLRDADLYVFDEATSALDGQTEEEIWECIKQLPRNKTILIISHKDDAFQLCDYVLNMG